MKKSERTDKVCIEKILGYIGDIKECFEHYGINSHEELEDKKLAQYATTQILTNIYGLKKKVTESTLSNLPEFDKIRLATARNIASHDYDEINFKIVYDICKKKLLSETVMNELKGAMIDADNLE